MNQYLEALNESALDNGLHIGLANRDTGWALYACRPITGAILNELPVRNLNGSLDAAADILRAWIEDGPKGAAQ
jgi:hypothetical protein